MEKSSGRSLQDLLSLPNIARSGNMVQCHETPQQTFQYNPAASFPRTGLTGRFCTESLDILPNAVAEGIISVKAVKISFCIASSFGKKQSHSSTNTVVIARRMAVAVFGFYISPVFGLEPLSEDFGHQVESAKVTRPKYIHLPGQYSVADLICRYQNANGCLSQHSGLVLLYPVHRINGHNHGSDLQKSNFFWLLLFFPFKPVQALGIW